jgi:hypothetical protein
MTSPLVSTGECLKTECADFNGSTPIHFISGCFKPADVDGRAFPACFRFALALTEMVRAPLTGLKFSGSGVFSVWKALKTLSVVPSV